MKKPVFEGSLGSISDPGCLSDCPDMPRNGTRFDTNEKVFGMKMKCGSGSGKGRMEKAKKARKGMKKGGKVMSKRGYGMARGGSK